MRNPATPPCFLVSGALLHPEKKPMFKPIRAIIAIVLLAIIMQPVSAGTKEELAELNAEMKALKQGQTQMQKDLDEIRKLLQKRAPAPVAKQQVFKPTDMQLVNAPIKGQNDARITLIGF
jgi:Skp family chaperone for outer membrane proteins